MKKLKIHFTGIKGVGMAPLAIIAKEAGFIVSGSDVGEEFITDAALKKAGIISQIGFSKDHIINQDIVIVTGAHGGLENIEAVAAKAKGIKIYTQGEAVGVFMNGRIFGKKYIGISVAGTHGKTTTTAILATILKENLLDPSYIIGTSDVGSLGLPGHKGRGKYFISEADEYATEPNTIKKAKLMWQFPQIMIITNIELDHPDIYKSVDEVRDMFLEFTKQLPKSGFLIACGDDEEVKRMLKDVKASYITYGFNQDNNYILSDMHVSGDHMFFTVTSMGTSLGEFMLRVVGEHNAQNALAAIVASLETGLSIDKIKKGLLTFSGSKRRLEYIGELRTGAKLYDDYAHHPTEILKTLKALRQQFSNKKIICIFQPHTYSRTKVLFEKFISSFSSVDTVILSDIYASLREVPDPSISSEMLANSMRDNHKDVLYLKDSTDVIKYLSKKKYRQDTVIVTMGAGDIYKIHSELERR